MRMLFVVGLLCLALGAQADARNQSDAISGFSEAQTELQGITQAAKSTAERKAATWKTVLVVIKNTRLEYVNPATGLRIQVAETLTDQEIKDAVDAYREFPKLVAGLSGAKAFADIQVVVIDGPVSRISPIGPSGFWLSADDFDALAKTALPRGDFDSVLVLWKKGPSVPSLGWGWGMYDETRRRTYGVITEAPTALWKTPAIGEPWLHEWLHGVSGFLRKMGEKLPDGDADGAGRHGYTQDPKTGWTVYYRDMLAGNVLERGRATGFSPEAWSCGRPSESSKSKILP